MEDILRPIYQERASMQSTLGILLIEKRKNASPITDTFDYILFVMVNEADEPVFVKHYTYQDQKAALHIVHEQQLKDWLLLGSNRKVVDWIQNGKILFDRNEFLFHLKTEIREFPFYGRKIKMGIEFAKLIRRYMDGKAFFENGHFLDAYNHVVHSLHHLARLEIIEQGFHPEVTVWNQVRHMEPEIFKLYEELVCSEESLEKRLELLFLASEFLIYSRTNLGSQHLLEVMDTKDDKWSIAELMEHPELVHYSVDLGVLLEYLIDKHVIDVVKAETKGREIFHRYYRV
ncbi:nucleotidyltransferase-like protein [Peribacillus glennii]|uniref:Nucleotidyltransferase-like domain-containing protein n=1 Tax=Peribacillus glennii TaxID=2303991 RepID=A0A372LB86_9BACI|nr:nucleotidyltransferase-like protein [Peribacillus glennii]RFU63016.1 hypothetical protein D0466_13835 [Peribacillus glennii]